MNKSWEYKKIGDVCIVERGGSPRPIDNFITEDSEGINWIKIGDTTDSMYITETSQKIIPEGMKKSRYVVPGDFLLSNSMSFGRPYILKIDGCIHDGWLVLRDKDNIFDKHFLYYYLSSKTTYEKFKQMAVGGVVNNLNSEMVRGVSVPIISRNEQEEIANILDKVSEILILRKKELEELDNLIKSRFVEMFDLSSCERKALGECTDFVDYRGHTPELSVDGTIRMVNAKSVGKGYFKYVDEYITEDTYDSWMHRGFAYPDDILFVTEGHTFGNTCLVPTDMLKFALGQRVITIKGHKEINNAFLCSYMQTDEFWRDINVYRTGGTAQGIRSKDLIKVVVPIPPLEEQEEFMCFVHQINKLKIIELIAMTLYMGSVKSMTIKRKIYIMQ